VITGPVHTTTRVIVNVEVSADDTELVRADRGGLIRPKLLHIEYINGRLWTCYAEGPKVRTDGHPYLDGSKGVRVYMKPGMRVHELSTSAPDWVKELVETYSPDKQSVSVGNNNPN
jgi:hypothetical protein